MADLSRYNSRIFALMTFRIYGIPANYSTGWTTGDVDFY